MPVRVTRRDFVKAAGTAFAMPAIVPASALGRQGGKPPSERITMGVIGVGFQARGHLGLLIRHPDVKVLAVCEVDRTRRENAKKMAEEWYSADTTIGTYKGCDAYVDFRELVARKDIDAVLIGTPDHWHTITAVEAMKAGKDVYCEKPLTLTIEEAKTLIDVARRRKTVFQVGSQQRSDREFRVACEAVRNGRIGKIKQVYVAVGGPSRPCDLGEEEMEPGLDWDMWLGQAPMRPYNSVLSPRGVHSFFPNWRSYMEYSGGGMTDWGAHHFDIAQWGLGMDESGPIEILPPNGADIKRLTYKYASGTIMHHGGLPGYNFGVVFVGTRGKVCVDRGRFQAEPESLMKGKFDELPVQLYKSTNHYDDFVRCVRSGQRPICDVEVGTRSVTVCHLGNLAYWNQRPLKWNPQTERFVGDDDANTWLDVPKRGPWKV